jgi:Effector Associated Constant Component 1
MHMTDVELVISGYPGIRPVELDAMARELAADVRQHARLTAQPQPATPSPGMKSGGAVELGKLVLTGVFSATTVKALSAVLRVWIEHRRAGVVKIRRGDDEVLIQGTAKEVSAALDRLPELWAPTD